MRPNVRSALSGLDFNAEDSEHEMDQIVAPRVPLEANVRPRVPQLGVAKIAPPAPANPPESQFIRAAKGGKLSDRVSAPVVAHIATPLEPLGYVHRARLFYFMLMLPLGRYKYHDFLQQTLMIPTTNLVSRTSDTAQTLNNHNGH